MMHWKNKFEPKLKEECGIFGILNSNNAATNIYLGLHALQHRGQEGSGITTFDGKKDYFIKKPGSVIQTFTKADLDSLKGQAGIGHVRYSTFGGSSHSNIQPFTFKTHERTYATCHNGNIINANEIKKDLERKGSVFFSDSDSEILGHLINHSKKESFFEKLIASLAILDGAFSFIILNDNKLYGCRDKNGIRPLVIGKISNDSYILASETVALDIVNAEYIRDIEPGEIVEIDASGKINSCHYTEKSKIKHNMCAMEFIYFSRPDSHVEGQNIHECRLEMGKNLASEHPVTADIVIGVPDSSLSSALGYSQASTIPYDIGLIKNRYIARSFIMTAEDRERILKIKLNPNKQVLHGKRVVLVDDSIVRGTTMATITKLIKKAGAKEIHLRIASPQILWPCFYGVDIKSKKELALANNTKDAYLKLLKDVDSLEFLSLEGLQKSLNRYSKDHKLCTSCFTGNYLTKLYSNKKE